MGELQVVRAREQELRDLANGQGGYFTARQAEALGFVRNHHAYHVTTGAWAREAHGIYRLAGVPVADPALAELHVWLLWTMGRKANDPQGALAYETALSVFGLSDLMIHRVHLWVPRAFRPSVIPRAVVLHRGPRVETDITQRDGLRVLRPIVAIVELLREGRVAGEHIERGFKDGLRNGVITRAELATLELKPKEHELLADWSRGRI